MSSWQSEEGEVSSSAVKQKTSMVEHRARTTKFFRSPVMPCRSTGMRLMLFPRRILSPTPSPPPDTLIRFTPALGQRIDIELSKYCTFPLLFNVCGRLGVDTTRWYANC